MDLWFVFQILRPSQFQVHFSNPFQASRKASIAQVLFDGFLKGPRQQVAVGRIVDTWRWQGWQDGRNM